MVISQPQNLSSYSGNPPLDGGNRKIAGGPLYDLNMVKEVAGKTGGVYFWTAKCIGDAAKLSLDVSDVGAMVQELSKTGYRDSEWCENGKNGWVASDAHSLTRYEYNEAARKELRCEYFLKFGVSKKGTVLLMVSCHL
jgi:hypothetical protein